MIRIALLLLVAAVLSGSVFVYVLAVLALLACLVVLVPRWWRRESAKVDALIAASLDPARSAGDRDGTQ